MDKAEFDRFADEYSTLHAANVKISGEKPEYFAEYKIRDISEISVDGDPVRLILDFGAGVGGSIPHVRHYFPDASLVCLDVSEKSLEIARTRFPGQAEFRAFDGKRIPLADDTVDVAFAACVLHHVPHSEHEALLGELRRVLRQGGRLFVFEHNPINPLTVRAVNTCPFDENAVLISAFAMRKAFTNAGFSTVQRRFRLFFPRSLSWLRPAERVLTWCGLGAQYCVIGTK